MAFFSQAWAIVRKDLLTELRGASTIVSMVLLGLLVVLVFNFGTEPGADSASLARSGVLWAAFLFSGVIAVGRSFASEKEAGCLDGLLLCPVDRGVIYLGKLLGNLILVFATGVVILLFFTVVYNVGIGAGWLRTAAAPGAGQRGPVDAGDPLRRGRGRGEGSGRPADRVHLPLARPAGHRRRALLHAVA